MKPNKPFVTVITPVYNGEAFLEEAIESVQQQNYQPLEIIIIDDGSTDDTARLAASLEGNIRYIEQANQGPAAARNTGIKAAQGKLITFLDVDDRWPAQKLHREMGYLAANPHIDIVQGLIQELEAIGEPPIFKESGTPYSFVNLGSASYRASVFERVGLFDETLRFDEDTDWFIRAWECGIVKVILDEISLYYRKHAGNMTNGVGMKQAGFVRLFKKHLDRQRRQGHQPAASAGNRPSITDYIGWANVARRKEK
jgi:glycosyltransferase involved in cell wall biosynthesis